MFNRNLLDKCVDDNEICVFNIMRNDSAPPTASVIFTPVKTIIECGVTIPLRCTRFWQRYELL